MAVPDTGFSSGVESFGHSARRYCAVAGYYSRSSQPAALTVLSARIQEPSACTEDDVVRLAVNE